jgi:hypothetical protein
MTGLTATLEPGSDEGEPISGQPCGSFFSILMVSGRWKLLQVALLHEPHSNVRIKAAHSPFPATVSFV